MSRMAWAMVEAGPWRARSARGSISLASRAEQPVRFDFRSRIRFFTNGRLKVLVRIRLGLLLRECGLPDLQVAEDPGMVDLEWVLGSGKSPLDGGAGSEWNTVR